MTPADNSGATPGLPAASTSRPEKTMGFTLRTDRALAETGSCERYVVVDLSPPPAPGHAERAPAHLSLVLDRSGSMVGGKLRLALRGARQVIEALDARDRFSVVVFSDEVDVVVPSTVATLEARREAVDRLRLIEARASTDLGAGWLTGAGEVGRELRADDVGRCILLTDGEANRGIVDPAELGRHARALRLRRVTTTTIGLGEAFNEFLLGRMAEEGGGHFHFAATEGQLTGIFARELEDLFAEAVRDVTVVIDAPPGTHLESLNGYVSDDGRSFSVGSLRGDRPVEAVFRVTLPADALHEVAVVGVRVRDRDGFFGEARQELTWRRASPDECTSEAPDHDVLVLVAELEDALARSSALACNHAAEYGSADAILDALVARLRGLAPGTPAIATLLDKLKRDRPQLTRPMTSRVRKASYLRSYSSQKRRFLEEHADEWTSEPMGEPPPPPPAPPAPGLEVYVGSHAMLIPASKSCRALAGTGVVIAGGPWLLTSSMASADVRAPLPRHLEDRLRRDLVAAAPGVSVVFLAQELDPGEIFRWHPQERLALVSIAGFPERTGAPLAAGIGYGLLRYSLAVSSARAEAGDFPPCAARDCVLGAHDDVGAIGERLRSGRVCNACTARLADAGIDPVAFAAQWAAVQALARPGR